MSYTLNELSAFKYLLVQFDEKNKLNQILTEVVPQSWVIIDDDDDDDDTDNSERRSKRGGSCLYPPEIDKDHVLNWVKLETRPDFQWQYYGVQILSGSDDFNQIYRRLERSFKQSNVDTPSETESAPKSSKVVEPQIHDEDSLNDILEQVEGLPDSNNLSGKIYGKKRKQDNTDKISAKKSKLQTDPPAGSSVEVELFRNEDKLEGATNSTSYIRTEDLETITQNIVQSMTAVFTKQLNNAVQSLKYDFNRKITEVKHTIILNLGLNDGSEALPELESLGYPMPIGNLATFRKFEADLKHEDKKAKVIAFINTKLISCNIHVFKPQVYEVLKAFMNPALQIRFSGQGGVNPTNKERKLPFNKTALFPIIKDSLYKICKVPPEMLQSVISKWLTGATERLNGKSNPTQNDKSKTQSEETKTV